ncbi:PREDICTED: pendrin-like [Drosophila arizonae]|uniref:Pendrin-like n=1 Tax=Drosophila arizonae TaxID=7263 RepID=A0ABM1Q035_DROAR|nr:PREDICTED: pendrin-like [Drosophila arizonae]
MSQSSENSESKPLNTNDNNEGNTKSTPKIQPKYSIHRDVLTHEIVIRQTGYSARDKSIPSSLRNFWSGLNLLSIFTGLIPILQWLPQYSLKRDLVGDIISGFTVAIMNIPHGMAYGMLAGVSAGNGLYMAVFPVIVYMFLGTSKHISIGTFAVASMMTQKVVLTYANVDSNNLIDGTMAGNNSIINTVLPPENVITQLDVATSLALAVGIVNVS